MLVSKISAQQKNQDRVNIFIDQKYCFSLTLDQLLEVRLKKGDELTQQQLADFKKMSDEGKQKARALDWLMRRPHSERELRDYLYRKHVDRELAEIFVEEFRTKKYLDDERFARWFAESRLRKNKSHKAIANELRTKGVSLQTIQSIVKELETTDYESLKLLVNKLRKRTRYKDETKLIQYLISKGFSYDTVKTAIHDELES